MRKQRGLMCGVEGSWHVCLGSALASVVTSRSLPPGPAKKELLTKLKGLQVPATHENKEVA